MYYYKHHIGDFNSETRHLPRIERSIYRDMIDLYLETELPLTPDFNLLCRKLMARTDEEVTGAEQVLNEFFAQTERGWVHARCEQVIAEYHQQSEKKSAAGKASAEARAAAKAFTGAAKTRGKQQTATDVEQALSNRSTNQEPITNNQKPITSEKKAETQRATRLPTAWTPTNDDIEFCQTERPDLDPQVTADSFRDYWIAQPNSKGCKLDWSATWRNWVRGEKRNLGTSPHAGKTPQKENFDAIDYGTSGQL